MELAAKNREKVQGIATGELPQPTQTATFPDENKNRGGHPEKFTTEIRNKILVALQNHHFMSTAAALAGVHTRTVYEWMKQGARDEQAGIESEYAKFCMQVEHAIATSEGRALKKISDSAERGDTTDAKWILERRHADRWAKKDKVEVGGDPSQPIVVQLTWPGAGVIDPHSELSAPSQQIIDAEVVDGDN